MKIKYFIILFACLFSANAWSAPVKVTATLDSALVEMGTITNIKINILDPDRYGKLINCPVPDTTSSPYAPFEIVDVIKTDVPTGIEYNVKIQAFRPGVTTIEPFKYVFGKDTAKSDILTLKILPVELTDTVNINPMRSVASVPSKWYDFIPNWLIWVIVGMAVAGLVIAGLYLWYIYRKTGAIPLIHKPKPVDPYERAITDLNRLRERKLAETGHEKEYYTALVDILRKYLEGRFQISAMEMSSTQILAALRSNPETKDNQDRIKQILEIADFVKFAKERPLQDDNIKSYNNVLFFVENTKPLPVVDEETDKTKTKK